MWSQCLGWISQAWVSVFSWFTKLIPADFVTPFFTALGIALAGRFLIAPLIGRAVHGQSDRVYRALTDTDNGRRH